MQSLIYKIRYLTDGILSLTLSYNTFFFLIFLFVFLCIYFLLRKQKAKQIWILFGSVVFYAWSGLAALFIVLATGSIVYLAARKMGSLYVGYEKEKEGLPPKEQTVLFMDYKKKAKKYLLTAMFLILAVWIYVKAGKLLELDSVATFSEWISGRGIIVPLGISYYSLSTIGYLLDVFWRKAKPEKNILKLFTVMTYFPHIVQGPISKYDSMLKQLSDLPQYDYKRVCFGLQLMLWGYIKKMIIADRLIIYTQAVFTSPEQFAGVEIFLAVVLCTIQLYADFSGCMDIVGGISQVMGIKLADNFRQPFFSKSATEFWTRWHISLGAWTKEYIYLPIAMNPKFVKYTKQLKKNGKAWHSSFIKAFVPLIAVWLFTGLWHGTGWDYIVWGLYWCILMTVAKEAKPIGDKIISLLKINTEKTYYQIWQSVRTCMIFAIGRMFTVTGALTGCAVLWKRLFAEHRLWTLFDGSLYSHGLDQKNFYVALLGIVIMLLVDIMHEKGKSIRQSIAAQPLPIRWIIYYGAMFAIVILGMYGPGYDASSFAYGAF